MTAHLLPKSARMPAAILTIATAFSLPALAQSTGTSSPSLTTLLSSIPSGTGYAAWDLCSRALSVGDDFDRVKNSYTAPKVQPLPSFWLITKGSNKVNVSAVLLSPKKAIFRPQLGCTLLNASLSDSTLLNQAFTPVPPVASDGSPWPVGEGAAQTQLLSPQRLAILKSAATAMFSESTTDASKKVNTNALLVAQDGKLVYEQYALPFNRDRLQLGWSMTKTLTALITGVMEKEGLLGLDQPVGLKAWQGTDKAGITWRQLLNMAPGLDWKEGGYGIGTDDTTQMLFSEMDQCAFVTAKPLVATPGTVFNYSTGFANLAMCRLKELAGGRHQNIYDYYQKRLFAPLGIRGGYIEPDASGTPVGGARGMLRPVDWLRLGQLVANNGQWNGRQILNASYTDFLRSPSPASAGYGGFMWRQPADLIPDDLRGKLPADLVFFAGFQGQRLVIVPSLKLIVLRQAVSFDDATATRQVFQLVADLAAAN